MFIISTFLNKTKVLFDLKNIYVYLLINLKFLKTLNFRLENLYHQILLKIYLIHSKI